MRFPNIFNMCRLRALDFDISDPFPTVIGQSRSENGINPFLNTLCVELTPTLPSTASPTNLHSQNNGIEAQSKDKTRSRDNVICLIDQRFWTDFLTFLLFWKCSLENIPIAAGKVTVMW